MLAIDNLKTDLSRRQSPYTLAMRLAPQLMAKAIEKATRCVHFFLLHFIPVIECIK